MYLFIPSKSIIVVDLCTNTYPINTTNEKEASEISSCGITPEHDFRPISQTPPTPLLTLIPPFTNSTGGSHCHNASGKPLPPEVLTSLTASLKTSHPKKYGRSFSTDMTSNVHPTTQV